MSHVGLGVGTLAVPLILCAQACCGRGGDGLSSKILTRARFLPRLLPVVPAPCAVLSTHLLGPCFVCSSPVPRWLLEITIQCVAMLSVLGRGPQLYLSLPLGLTASQPHSLIRSAACYTLLLWVSSQYDLPLLVISCSFSFLALTDPRMEIVYMSCYC